MAVSSAIEIMFSPSAVITASWTRIALRVESKWILPQIAKRRWKGDA
jgi:hypothetical protein